MAQVAALEDGQATPATVFWIEFYLAPAHMAQTCRRRRIRTGYPLTSPPGVTEESLSRE
ncbi:hypothetical protein MY1884_008388 [Beauveria asiatica]